LLRIPFDISNAILGLTDNPIVFLLIINIIMIIVGMFLDAVSAITVMTPVLLPTALAIGVDPIIFGVVLTVNLSIGVLTPPVGLNLYVTSSIAKIGILKISKTIIPFILMILMVLIIMMFI
jgi:C4-dicarboxylate transporter DctM subunit